MRKDEGGARRLYIDIDLPCPTIMAGGVGSVNCSQYELVDMTTWLHLGAHGFKPETQIELDTQPCPSVAATGLGSYKYWIENDGIERERVD
jgi:hypothetical protein